MDWRRVRDLNPRYQKGTLVFETSSFDHSDNSPFLIFYINSFLPFHQILALSGKKERKHERNLILHRNVATRKPFVYAGLKPMQFHEAEDFSSAAPSTTRTTLQGLSQHQNYLGKRGELMGRTSKNIKFRIPENPVKSRVFA